MREEENPNLCSDILVVFKVEPDNKHGKGKGRGWGVEEMWVLVLTLPLTPWEAVGEPSELRLDKVGAPDGF